MEDRPNESTLLEFPKEQCIAAIGEDLPEALLASFGVRMVVGGERSKKRMVVNRCLETCRPNLYLVGDLLSQAYFETEDFEADPAGFEEVKHRGNIKSALRDGVLVAQVIRQRLDGKSEIDVTVEEAASPAASAPLPKSEVAEGPPAGSLDENRGEGGASAVLIRELPTGVQADEFRVDPDGVTTIGRAGCDLSFPEDSAISDVHASISHGDEGYVLRDDGGATGVFVKAPPGRKLHIEDRDLVRLGKQFLLFSRAGESWELIHYDAAGQERARRVLGAKPIVVGRAAPDLILDPEDGTLSRRHLAVSVEEDRVAVKDLKSVNGTYLKVRGARRLEHGDRIRVGQQSLIFSERAGEALDEGAHAGAPAVPRPMPEPQAETPTATSEGPVVFFKGSNREVALSAGETVCEAAEANGIAITAECHSGICGSDPIRILSGSENLSSELSDQERETLEEICDLEPGPCRLACMVRIKGRVEVEVVES